MPSQYHLDFNVKGSGFKVNETSGANIQSHKLVYREANSLWYIADASSAAAMPVLGITMGAMSANRKGEILRLGYIGDDSWTWTPGGEIYASDTAGELTQVAGTVSQVIGMAVTATMIWFNSDLGNVDGGIPAAHAASHQDGGSDEISVAALSGELADAQPVAISKNSGAIVGTRSELNLIEGDGVTITVTDDAGNDEVDITIASGSITGYTTIVRYDGANYTLYDGITGAVVTSHANPDDAIEAASARGGRFVTKGQGETWTTVATITLDDASVTWESDWDLIIAAPNSLNNTVVNITANDVRLIGVHIDGNRANNTNTSAHGIQFSTERVQILNCFVEECGSMGISCVNGGDFVIDGCWIEFCDANGITAAQTAGNTGGIISNCHVYKFSDVGITTWNSNYVIVSNCECSYGDLGTSPYGVDSNLGFAFEEASQGSQITGCLAHNCDTGFSVTATSPGADLLYKDCHAVDNDNGFMIGSSDEVTLIGCTVEAFTGHGMRVLSSSTNFAGYGIVIKNSTSGSYGAELQGTDGTLFVTMYNLDCPGVYLNAATSWSVNVNCYDFSGGNDIGVLIETTSSLNRVAGMVHNCDNYGVKINNGADRNLIDVISHDNDYGIRVDGANCDLNQLNGVVYNNTTSDVSDAGTGTVDNTSS